MRRLIIFIATCCLACVATAQVKVVGDVAAKRMMERHVELVGKVKTVPGYRVQIASFSGANSKDKAFATKDRFMVDYPLVQAYITFDEPNFKVKVGDFRTRLEAFAFMQEIKDFYKGYIVRDNIYPEQPEQLELTPDEETAD